MHHPFRRAGTALLALALLRSLVLPTVPVTAADPVAAPEERTRPMRS